MECLECGAITKNNDKWCCKQHKIKWLEKEDKYFVQCGFIVTSRNLTDKDKLLQKRFIKKLKAKDKKEKLKISGGVV